MCLSLTYFTWYDNLWVHPCCCKWHYFILFNGWIIFHCIYIHTPDLILLLFFKIQLFSHSLFRRLKVKMWALPPSSKKYPMPLSNILAITLLFSLPMLTTHSCKRHGVKTPLYLVIQRKYMVTQKTLISLSLASMTERIRGKRIIFIPSYCYCCYVASVMSDTVRSHRWKPTRLPHPWDSPGKSTGVNISLKFFFLPLSH